MNKNNYEFKEILIGDHQDPVFNYQPLNYTENEYKELLIDKIYDALNCLPGRTKKILLDYFDGKNQKDIAKDHNITQSHISQIIFSGYRTGDYKYMGAIDKLTSILLKDPEVNEALKALKIEITMPKNTKPTDGLG